MVDPKGCGVLLLTEERMKAPGTRKHGIGPLKNLQIVLASSDRLEGRVAAIHMAATEVTAIIDRDHIDPDFVPRMLRATRVGLGELRRVAAPSPTPNLPFRIISTEAPPFGPSRPLIEATSGGVVEHIPEDAASPALMAYAAVLGREVMRWYQPPVYSANLLLSSNGPHPLARKAS